MIARAGVALFAALGECLHVRKKKIFRQNIAFHCQGRDRIVRRQEACSLAAHAKSLIIQKWKIMQKPINVFLFVVWFAIVDRPTFTEKNL